MNIIKKIAKVFINIILIIFILVMSIYMVSKYIFKDEVPNVLGFSILKVVSGSMESTIKINNFIVIKSSSNYNLGDIVTYQDQNNNLVTHRIISIKNNEIITKGDNNNIEDEPIIKENIKGKVVLIFNNLFSSFNLITLFVIFFIGCFITIMIPDKKRG